MRESTIGTIFEGPSGVDNEISFGRARLPEFDNVDVRQAMLMAVDRQSIIDNIYGGAAQLVPCLYGLPNLTGDVQPQPYDPAAAKALLDGSGETFKDEYIFDTYYNDPLSANVMTAIQQKGGNLGQVTRSDGSCRMTTRFKEKDLDILAAPERSTGTWHLLQ